MSESFDDLVRGMLDFERAASNERPKTVNALVRRIEGIVLSASIDLAHPPRPILRSNRSPARQACSMRYATRSSRSCGRGPAGPLTRDGTLLERPFFRGSHCPSSLVERFAQAPTGQECRRELRSNLFELERLHGEYR